VVVRRPGVGMHWVRCAWSAGSQLPAHCGVSRAGLSTFFSRPLLSIDPVSECAEFRPVAGQDALTRDGPWPRGKKNERVAKPPA